MVDIAPGPIMKIATGFMAAKQLFAASEIGLFEALGDRPAGLEELVGKSLGLIDQEGGRYRNGEAAATPPCRQAPSRSAARPTLLQQHSYPHTFVNRGSDLITSKARAMLATASSVETTASLGVRHFDPPTLATPPKGSRSRPRLNDATGV